MRVKKILIIDWFDKYGGAERVISSLQSVLDFDKTYCLINNMTNKDLYKIYGRKSNPIIHQTVLRFSKRKFRFFFIFFHTLIDKITVDKSTEIIISSSHSVAKGIRKTNKSQLHISYFQARNFKYIWDDKKLYFGKMYIFLTPIIKFLQNKDVKQAQRPDHIITNSFFVQNWVKKTYKRDSTVIYPPVDVAKFKLEKDKKDYFITVGRLEPYKRFDLIVEAFNILGNKLIVVGNGSKLQSLRKIAKKNISFTGFLEADEVYKLIKEAKGFIHSGIEDFGIAPVEAQACGTPVIGLGKGGLTETIVNNETGVLFREQNVNSIIEAIYQFEKLSFDYEKIREHSLKFSKERFEKEIENFVKTKYNDFLKYEK